MRLRGPPSKHFENRTKTLMDVVRDRLGFPDPPGPLNERIKLQKQREEANKRLDQYGYGVPVEVGGMWGNKPTLINGREVFTAQYPGFEARTPYSAESVATSVERYLNPEHPRVVPDDQTWRRKWDTGDRGLVATTQGPNRGDITDPRNDPLLKWR